MSQSITVLIPTKNRHQLLGRALQSVFKQTVPPEEIVVVNDGSTDGTKELLAGLKIAHPTLRVIHQPKNLGVNVARNTGIKISHGEWVAFLDDDDEFLPMAIETMKRRIAETPASFNILYFNSKIDNYKGRLNIVGGFQFPVGLDHYDGIYEEVMTKKGLLGDCTAVIKRSLFIKDDYRFPESVNGFESYLMDLIARDNKGIRYYPDVLTQIHLDRSFTHLSFTASKQKPWPLLALHFKQLFQHYKFYLQHLPALAKKSKQMARLGVRSIAAWVGL